MKLSVASTTAALILLGLASPSLGEDLASNGTNGKPKLLRREEVEVEVEVEAMNRMNKMKNKGPGAGAAATTKTKLACPPTKDAIGRSSWNLLHSMVSEFKSVSQSVKP